MVMKRKNTRRKFPVPVNMCRSRLTLWILKKNDMSSETVSRSALTSEQPLGLTSTCWQVWISFPISDSSSLFLLIRLLRLESRACCGKKKKHTDVRTTEREWGMKRENGLDVRSSVAEEDKERNRFYFFFLSFYPLGFSAQPSRRSCRTTSGATSQHKIKLWYSYFSRNRKNEQNKCLIPQEREAASLRKHPRDSFLKSFYVPPSAGGDTPRPCTASSSCPVRASDSGSYSSVGCDWDSHSTEHQAMRKPGQAAN